MRGHLFQTKDLDGSRSPDGAGGASAAAAFRTQVLGDDDEAVRDLQWLAEFTGGASSLALVATEQDTEGKRAKLVVGSAMTLDQTAPVAIAEGVRAFAVARGPDDDDDVFEAGGTARWRTPPPARTPIRALAAWAPFGGGAVVARLTDAGYSAEMTHYPVGPCEEGAADVVVNGLAFLVGDEAPAGQKNDEPRRDAPGAVHRPRGPRVAPRARARSGATRAGRRRTFCRVRAERGVRHRRRRDRGPGGAVRARAPRARVGRRAGVASESLG